MKLIVDIMHIPHINFLKNAVYHLKTNGEDITIVCLDRGKNVSIVKKEFQGFDVVAIGKHKGTFLSIIFQANMLRIFSITNYLLLNRYDCGLSVGSFLLGFALKLFGKPNLQFADDPENRKNLFLQKLTSTKLFYPTFFSAKGISNFNALKEWAYLSPRYFVPNNKVLYEYNLKEKEYIFIREVNTKTTNYLGQAGDLILSVSNRINSDIKVVLSLENKKKKELYPENWIILNEPVEDIHSLMYFSSIVISSGDSMVREGSMLGVPSIYCGIRKMLANKVMNEKGLLFQKNIDELVPFIDELYNKKFSTKDQIKFRQELEAEWDDVTEIIISEILKFKK